VPGSIGRIEIHRSSIVSHFVDHVAAKVARRGQSLLKLSDSTESEANPPGSNADV